MTLRDKYQKEFVTRLKEELQLDNVMSVPKLTKIVINVGAKEALTDKKVLAEISDQIGLIAGQKPSVRIATKSIAAFKLREGQEVGVAVTLRGQRMYEFFEKLVNIVFPRVRDFRGVSVSGFDGRGNFSVGFKEQIVFSEIEYGKIDRIRGLQVTIVTTARNDKEGKALLTILGMPFEKATK